LRSGASKLGASRKAPPKKRDTKDRTKNSGEAGRNPAIQEQTESGAAEKDGAGSIVSSAQSNASLGPKRGRMAHASVGPHSKQPSSVLEPIQQVGQEHERREHQRHGSGKTAVAVGNLEEDT
jgi:hypothetical protein